MSQIPKKWCVERTYETHEEINNWINNNPLKNDQTDYHGGNGLIYSERVDNGYQRIGPSSSRVTGFTEISFEQFKKWFLIHDFRIGEILEPSRLSGKVRIKLTTANNSDSYSDSVTVFNEPKKIFGTGFHLGEYCIFLDEPNYTGNNFYIVPVTEALRLYPERDLRTKQNKSMKIKLRHAFVLDAIAAIADNDDRMNFFKENVAPYTFETTEEAIQKYYERYACEAWTKRMEQEFPFLKDNIGIAKNVNISPELETLCSEAGLKQDAIQRLTSQATDDKYVNRGLYITNDYIVEVSTTSNGGTQIILVKNPKVEEEVDDDLPF